MTTRTPYTPEDDALIRRMVEDKHTTKEIATELNRHPSSVGRRMEKLGFQRVRRLPARKWTPEMDSIIRKFIHRENREKIANRIGNGVTKCAVISRIKRLGLTGIAPDVPRAWQPDEDEFLRENVGAMTQSDMGRELNRDPSSVSRRLSKLGIKPDRPVAPVYAVPKAKKAPEVVPLTARPWLTRTSQECKYLYGERHAYLACCQPVWMETGLCEAHAALCGGYKRREAA